jgi:polyhydroxyalkanoate synthesis regulator phasin
VAWTDAEERRILAIEKLLNDLQITTKNLAAKQQIAQLLLIKQAEIDALTKRVTALESMIAIIQDSL